MSGSGVGINPIFLHIVSFGVEAGFTMLKMHAFLDVPQISQAAECLLLGLESSVPDKGNDSRAYSKRPRM